MMTMKELMENPNHSSPNGKYWEPALPLNKWTGWRVRVCDAWAVWKGQATAIRQTTKADIANGIGGEAIQAKLKQKNGFAEEKNI